VDEVFDAFEKSENIFCITAAMTAVCSSDLRVLPNTITASNNTYRRRFFHRAAFFLSKTIDIVLF